MNNEAFNCDGQLDDIVAVQVELTRVIVAIGSCEIGFRNCSILLGDICCNHRTCRAKQPNGTASPWGVPAFRFNLSFQI
jgi:hypothetical protein